jgi:membrane-bound lytic murein transglycosylase A
MAGSCAPVPEPVPEPPVPSPYALQRLAEKDVPTFEDLADVAPLLSSIENSLVYFRRQPGERLVAFGPHTFTMARLIRSLEVFSEIIAKKPPMDELNRTLRDQYAVYRSIGRNKEKNVLFTGYYEPIIQGRLNASPGFSVPVYSRPTDLISIDLSPFADDLKGRTIVGRYTGRTVVPYPTREQIREESDFGKIAPPVAWLADKFDLFNLQIQGSGRLELESGEQVNILYDGSNERPYRSIGRLLIDQGHIARENLTMQAIRNYLRDHPDSADAILNHNPRFIFFRIADNGPLGAMGQPLTPLRSIAVDRRAFPLGALSYIETPLARVAPGGTIDEWALHRGFALAQDTGGAIKGPGRVDLFMGHGIAAETAAGHLKHPGALYFLVLKPAAGH